MLSAHRVEQIRTAEAVLLDELDDGALMARAATGLAHCIADFLRARHGRTYGTRVLLLVGSGNNGGDALFAGAWLAGRGVAVRMLPLGDSPHPAGLVAARAAGARLIDLDEARRFDPQVVVDGIVGIGGHPGLRPDAEAALAALAGAPVIAVDLPSGVDTESGETPATHVTAELTITFGTHKVATLVDPAASACGDVVLLDIGLALPEPVIEVLEARDVAALLPLPQRRDHKYTRGVVGVRAGSPTYPGAASLCVAGAATGLVGMVRYVGQVDVERDVRRRFPEVVGAGQVQAWAVGSGGAEGAGDALAAALADGVPVVVDADALAHASGHLVPGHDHRVVLTPHAGELAAMLDVGRDEVEAAPLRHAAHAAERFGACVLLKGSRTVVVSPTGRVRVNPTGTPWLATAGAGDVLTGLIGALLAAGLDLLDAASVGAWLHGAAAERAAGGGPLVASDVARLLPGSVRDLAVGMRESPA
ncbi:bifunctional ADP-dependent NAD(P)H-hydrate dehydratase/NAD(P)H-hydrate epimerase [Nocardioides gilvus]|uniref:bifunctional ADP-dependent NAD(P)H-hydrate dehydratase/NAD(P)H-hydrate epimerase n=1 Tax=Nocardioides gilvus TaxID=1735589 RepID=UPI000D747B8F|nr:bifunctional ADP-dependent NAD(P)H-hydrate dehydratase/NAD(P)H-hydrate epimerase [Nocardioides gilvus]